jgi:hypothetical protein
MKISVSPVDGTDYDTYIKKDNHGTWTSYLIQYERASGTGGNQTLNIQHNYRQVGNNSVTLSLKLGVIGYPTNYLVNFYTKYMHLFEQTMSYILPPHRDIIHIAMPSSPYPMIAGDNASIPLRINYTDLTPGDLSLSDPGGNGKVSLKFDQPNVRSLSQQHHVIIKMWINGTQNLDPGVYPITVNKTYITADNLKLNLPSDNFYIRILPKTPIDSALIFFKNDVGYVAPLIVITVITVITVASAIIPEAWPWFVNRTRRQVRIQNGNHAQGAPVQNGNHAQGAPVQNGNLKASDILTVDGAVITGVLVLLSLTQKTSINQFLDVNTINIVQLIGHSLFTVLTATIVYPFAVSAIIVAIENSRATYPKFGLRIMAAGFVYLILTLFAIGLFQF